jgi:hypothetical protein
MSWGNALLLRRIKPDTHVTSDLLFPYARGSPLCHPFGFVAVPLHFELLMNKFRGYFELDIGRFFLFGPSRALPNSLRL